MSPFYSRLAKTLGNTRLEAFKAELISRLDLRYARPGHGSFKDWQHIVESLPDISPSFVDLDRSVPIIGKATDCTAQHCVVLRQGLMALSPWRKGPFNVFGIDIDAEWRSDWKWLRIAPHLADLKGKTILDIGCSNGYYALRMQASGAALVLGVEPVWRYVFQFSALTRYLPEPQRVFVLPLRLEELPGLNSVFDTVFSMGVLYHSRQPKCHLDQVYRVLRTGGQFVVETLIIENGDVEALIPQGRYANMRNVWMIPTYTLLEAWLKASGFINIQLIDKNRTTVREQRQTEWMTGYSLGHALDSDDYHRTVEGYPAPLRASIVAEKPF